jgi:hypothetical protein
LWEREPARPFAGSRSARAAVGPWTFSRLGSDTVRERTWLAYDSPTRMLEHLTRRRCQRKLRLLAAAWCRRVWHLLGDERLQAAEEAGERFADGEVRPADFDQCAGLKTTGVEAKCGLRPITELSSTQAAR